jgi:hypothetical protein
MDRFVPRDDGGGWIASFLAMTAGMDRFVPRDDGGKCISLFFVKKPS